MINNDISTTPSTTPAEATNAAICEANAAAVTEATSETITEAADEATTHAKGGDDQDDNTKRHYGVMYVQQMDKLPLGTVEKLEAAIKKQSPERWAYIVHDKDTQEDGKTPAAKHVHVMMTFKSAHRLSSIANAFGEFDEHKENGKKKREFHLERFEFFDGKGKKDKSGKKLTNEQSHNNGFAYLVHATDKAKKGGKYQYSPYDVNANFNYCALLDKMGIEIAQAKKEKAYNINHGLDMLLLGLITKDELISQLTGSQIAKYSRQIDTVHAQYLANEAARWREQMKATGQVVKVGWLYGKAGTGKTSFARELAERDGRDYFVAGSTRDPYQGYNGQHIVILDELRPNSIPEYADLLRLLDPFGSDVMAPSRYQDKAIMADTIYITSPYDPVTFYHGMLGDCPSSCRDVDNIGQLLRRLSLVIEMSDGLITLMEYQERGQGYIPSAEPPRQNPYSLYARKGPPLDSVAEFNRLFDDPAATDDSSDSTPPTDEDTAPNE